MGATWPKGTETSVFIWLALLLLRRLAQRVNPCHYLTNDKQKMYELTKAIFFLAISAPILYGVNSLTNSVSTYPDPAVFAVDTVTISTQAYH